MTRLIKFLTVTGLSSVYLMQVACTTTGHGFSIIQNGIIPNPLAGITASISAMLAGMGLGT